MSHLHLAWKRVRRKITGSTRSCGAPQFQAQDLHLLGPDPGKSYCGRMAQKDARATQNPEAPLATKISGGTGCYRPGAEATRLSAVTQGGMDGSGGTTDEARARALRPKPAVQRAHLAAHPVLTYHKDPQELLGSEALEWSGSAFPKGSQFLATQVPEAKRATSMGAQILRLRRDPCTCLISRDAVNLPAELCRRRSGSFMEVARLAVPEGARSQARVRHAAPRRTARHHCTLVPLYHCTMST